MRGGRAPRRMLIVDGYNIINARRDGAPGGPASLADARDRLLSELMDYAGYSDQQVVLVFDAWMSDREQRTEEKHGGVTVVYTQKGEIADRYIERLCDDLAADIDLPVKERCLFVKVQKRIPSMVDDGKQSFPILVDLGD